MGENKTEVQNKKQAMIPTAEQHCDKCLDAIISEEKIDKKCIHFPVRLEQQGFPSIKGLKTAFFLQTVADCLLNLIY